MACRAVSCVFRVQKLGLDIDQLGIDAEAIADLDRRENNKGEGKKKFVSPYASNTSLDTSVCAGFSLI
jgi:hypothetical protein